MGRAGASRQRMAVAAFAMMLALKKLRVLTPVLLLAAFLAGHAPAVLAEQRQPTTASKETPPPQVVKRSPATPSPPVPGVPHLSKRHKVLYRESVLNDKDLNMFAVAGDCNSIPPVYLKRVLTGEFDASKLSANLRETMERFKQAFSRVSLASNGGFTAAGLNDPAWSDGALCGPSQSPLACEIWVSRASVIFVSVGTGDQYAWRDFEDNYREIVETALHRSVLPVLVTKADDLETRQGGAPPDYINNVIRKQARDYDVPLMDYALAARSLPNRGLIDEGTLDFHASPAGMDLRIVMTLQILDQLWR